MHRARGGFLIGCDVFFAHGTREARRGHGRGLSCVNYLGGRGVPYCCCILLLPMQKGLIPPQFVVQFKSRAGDYCTRFLSV